MYLYQKLIKLIFSINSQKKKFIPEIDLLETNQMICQKYFPVPQWWFSWLSHLARHACSQLTIEDQPISSNIDVSGGGFVSG